ncbi:MAG: heavy metal-associated domain-containing protein [Crocinitomicaceae bacterium]|nr:heavy metal-associated domain-containing protein [Crocinitomicaceae bacterium]
MKKAIFTTIVLALISLSSFGQADIKKKKETFTVYGNCGMCERTIEAAVTDQKGVFSADWNQETKKMVVSYNPEKITLEKIKQRIANAGYDSDSHRATDKKYNALHGCCQYERPE